jgi:hypothetical protein
MNSLLAYFNDNKSELRRQLDKAATLEQVVMLVRDSLEALREVSLKNLTAPQARTALPMLDVLSIVIGSLSSATKTQVWYTRTEMSRRSSLPFSRVWQAVTSLLGLHPAERTRVTIQVDSQMLLNTITQALSIIDRTLPLPDLSSSPAEKLDLANLQDVLKFLQELLGVSNKPDAGYLHLKAEQIPDLLQDYGISVEFYQPDVDAQFDTSAERKHKFEPSIDADIKEYQVLLPALLAGDRVLLRGRVTKPASVG